MSDVFYEGDRIKVKPAANIKKILHGCVGFVVRWIPERLYIVNVGGRKYLLRETEIEHVET